MRIGVIGGGILGLSIAYKLQSTYNKAKILLFEKEKKIGLHQSGRNSGVLHAGLSYKPGSIKAKLSSSGIKQMVSFCRKYDIPHDICGKILVANNNEQVNNLTKVYENGLRNGLNGLKFLSNSELKQREPNIISKKTLLVPEEGIVDYSAVMKKLYDLILKREGEVFFSTKITSIKNFKDKCIVKSNHNHFECDLIINCSGLFSDRNFKKFTNKPSPFKIIPFRGDYYNFKQEYNDCINHLVYPVPDIKYPFLGLHFSRLINNDRIIGPNAVLAFKREGYEINNFSFKDFIEVITYRGFYKFVSKNLFFSLKELGSSVSKSLFIKEAKKMMPEIKSKMLVKGVSGVRAQSVSKSGELLMDFYIKKDKNQLHVLNAPSPGATASLAIADYIIKELW